MFNKVQKSITKQSISGQGEFPENHDLGLRPKYLVKPMRNAEFQIESQDEMLGILTSHRKPYKTKQNKGNPIPQPALRYD